MTDVLEALPGHLKSLRLGSFLRDSGPLAERARQRGWDPLRYLGELAAVEVQDRFDRRVERLTRASKLPKGKTLETLDLQRLPQAVRGRVPWLGRGEFLAEADNICIFGNPGTGKTHLMAALGWQLVTRGHPVLFAPARALMERLTVAKRELRLNRELDRLDRYQCLLLDDIGYVRQGRTEMEMLFHVLAERYERRSVMLTSNLVFSQWDQIFPDAMTAAAAIDRVVHHSQILELDIPSYRSEAARRRQAEATPERAQPAASGDRTQRGAR